MSMPIKSEPYARSTESLDLPHADEERVAFIPGSSRDHVESRGPEADSTQGLQNDDSSRWKSRLYNLYQNNTGLLLISLSQLCQSCMNISVKILNGLDPPVPPFEVRLHCTAWLSRRSARLSACETFEMSVQSWHVDKCLS